jgi:glycosyltransferase involved in cell wall biosynthesis
MGGSPARILHIITGLEAGGAERQLLNLVTALNSGRYHHDVVSLLEEGFFESDLRASGAGLYSLRLARGQIAPSALFRLAKLIRTRKPDLVQTWLYHADLAGLLTTWLGNNKPVIWTIRNSKLDTKHYSKRTAYMVPLLAQLSHLPAAIVANSVAGMEVHRQLGYRPKFAAVIPNGIDTSMFHPCGATRARVRAELGIADTEPVVGCIARRDPMKGHDALLRAFAGLAGHPRLLLAGRGTEAGNLELLGQIAAAGLDPARVIRLGERHDIERIMPALDVFVLASAFGEGFPNVIGEAMACGLPCVVTDVGDSARILGDCGEVAVPNDAAALTAAIERLLSLSLDQRFAIGAKARGRVEEKYNVSIMASNYASLYARFLNGTVSPGQTAH